jgi:hypothetical protein
VTYARGVFPPARIRVACLVCLTGAVGPLLPSLAAAAPVLSPLSGRDYDLDLHASGARGSPRIVGMGGTTAALAEGAGGLLGNPAAVAVRPLSSPGRWDWDAHVDSFAPAIGSDFDNNGIPSTERLEANISTAAILVFFGPWGLGLGADSVTYTLAPAPNATMAATTEGQSTAGVAHLVLARSFLAGAFSLGLGLRIGDFSLLEGEETIFDVAGVSTEVGLALAPPQTSWRAGLRVSLPVHGDTLDARCDPNDCRGFVLPRAVVAPWEVAVGAAFRLAPTPWNMLHTGRYRDEAALVVSAELLVTGPLARAAGFEAFLGRQLQRSGHATTVSPRLGLEKEWLPGRLRLRLGGYWEPARFEGVGGRGHLTAGAELRLFAFRFWGAERRVALALAADAAPRYGNAGLSIGFWH